jgi:hypothetical protein
MSKTLKIELPIEFEIEAVATPVIPGRYTGKPENCYPDEGGELDIEDIMFEGQTVNRTLWAYITQQYSDLIYEELIEQIKIQKDDFEIDQALNSRDYLDQLAFG